MASTRTCTFNIWGVQTFIAYLRKKIGHFNQLARSPLRNLTAPVSEISGYGGGMRNLTPFETRDTITIKNSKDCHSAGTGICENGKLDRRCSINHEVWSAGLDHSSYSRLPQNISRCWMITLRRLSVSIAFLNAFLGKLGASFISICWVYPFL